MADTNKKALIVYGGWDGHQPKECAELFAPLLDDAGYDVLLSDSLEIYEDEDLMPTLDVILPIWTMGKINDKQWQGLKSAVYNGCGFAGFHGGILDAFRENSEYQFMTGGQFVDHPGNCEPTYTVRTVEPDHPITQGIDAFTLQGTEQYYMHTDPGINVLMTSVIQHGKGDITTYPIGVEMPYCWTRTWGKGKIFAAAWGHNTNDFDVPEAKEIVLRGLLWASR